MSRTLIHSVILAALELCIAASACAADASAPAFAMPGPLPCLDSAARVQGHAMLHASVSAAVGQVGKQFHVPDWQPGLTLYDRTLDSVYGMMLADSDLTARFARVSGETYVRYILARGTPEQQQSFGRWLAGTEVGGRFWTLVVDEGLCAGLLDGLAENAQVTSPEDRLAVRDWQAKRQADPAQWHSDDTQDAGFQVNARLWLGLLRQAPFDQGAVWGRVLATGAGEEEPILKAMRPALAPLLPEIDAAGKAAAASASTPR